VLSFWLGYVLVWDSPLRQDKKGEWAGKNSFTAGHFSKARISLYQECVWFGNACGLSRNCCWGGFGGGGGGGIGPALYKLVLGAPWLFEWTRGQTQQTRRQMFSTLVSRPCSRASVLECGRGVCIRCTCIQLTIPSMQTNKSVTWWHDGVLPTGRSKTCESRIYKKDRKTKEFPRIDWKIFKMLWRERPRVDSPWMLGRLTCAFRAHGC
jgi:hypothetical protein